MFTAEQDTIIVMAYFQSGTRSPNGTWSYSLQSCIDQFNKHFPEANFTYDAFRQVTKTDANLILSTLVSKKQKTHQSLSFTFHYILGSLDTEMVKQISDFIYNLPKENQYKVLKQKLIAEFANSEERSCCD
ncbi:hypothetical protein RN001_011944 [Aquatica leii]|uniref:DUF7041 domain-containing protein n=1 Tax=Aquatica leii TaxID=1421715 RepID=A0AAN7SD28_9COLE|nr:hypothetical protein RN001_011944 [Aquatica leii]